MGEGGIGRNTEFFIEVVYKGKTVEPNDNIKCDTNLSLGTMKWKQKLKLLQQKFFSVIPVTNLNQQRQN